MTRKDYVALAKAVRLVDNDARNANDAKARETIAAVVEELGHALKADNGRFDRERFAAACGVKV